MVEPGMQMLAAGLRNVTVSGTGLVAVLFWHALRSAGQRADLCRCASCIGLVKLASN